MNEKTVAITTPDGQAPARLFTPAMSAETRWPGVVYLTDIWGIRPATEKMARRVADQGYAVLMPHLFYRNRPVVFDPLTKGQPRDRDAVPELLASLPASRIVSDGVA